jgi:hypothetical protein
MSSCGRGKGRGRGGDRGGTVVMATILNRHVEVGVADGVVPHNRRGPWDTERERERGPGRSVDGAQPAVARDRWAQTAWRSRPNRGGGKGD